MKTITIDRVKFEVKKSFNLEFMGEDIYEAYNKPSETKITPKHNYIRYEEV